MGISSRCTDFNLLNHLKQKNIDYNIEYVMLKDYTGKISEKNTVMPYHWVCTLNLKNHKYIMTDSIQKRALKNILLSNDTDLRTYL